MENIEEVLDSTENLILEKTGESLKPIEEAILKGVWSGKKYSQIAKEYNDCSESHVKKEASKLWEKLREELGEDLKKKNFRSKVEKRHRISDISQCSNCVLQEIDINIVGQFVQTIHDVKPHTTSTNSYSTRNTSPIIDLTDSPELTNLYNRTTELNTLKQWILQDKIRLITIYGLSGIGKSILTRQLIEQIKTEFDYIIWRSLTDCPTLSSLKKQLQEFFSQSQQSALATLIDDFRHARCLVILDDLQNLFQSGELAGQYLTEYKDYATIFQQIAKTSHQSCVILLSWEKPREITTLKAEKSSSQALYLKGLESGAEEILQEHGLTNPEKWSDLINLYQGHPTWLHIIASTIVELFDSSVSLFLDNQEQIFIGDLKPMLESHLERLSQLEKQVISWLVKHQTVDIFQTNGLEEFSKSELTEAIQSLVRRGLVEKIPRSGRSLFQINPIWQQLNLM